MAMYNSFEYFSKSEQRQVPYGKILTTFSVWAIWIAAFGNFTCVNLMFLFSPTFLHAVLGFHVHHTGLTAAFAPLLQFAIKISCGIASDKIRNVDESVKLKVGFSEFFFNVKMFTCAPAKISDNISSKSLIFQLSRSSKLSCKEFFDFVTY
ncbi:unnamed protein product [Anisakis simplex]|uniref:TPT domain-containing protein n=1 Tax=Anisakis simplex TaxID=6269 RepID=A0A0M3JN58_ANISI|nr:unnamed protein product [Anisakis simplex]